MMPQETRFTRLFSRDNFNEQNNNNNKNVTNEHWIFVSVHAQQNQRIECWKRKKELNAEIRRTTAKKELCARLWNYRKICAHSFTIKRLRLFFARLRQRKKPIERKKSMERTEKWCKIHERSIHNARCSTENPNPLARQFASKIPSEQVQNLMQFQSLKLVWKSCTQLKINHSDFFLLLLTRSVVSL